MVVGRMTSKNRLFEPAAVQLEGSAYRFSADCLVPELWS